MTKVKYTGTSGVRIVGSYQWDASNNFVVNIPDSDSDTLATLAAHEGFEVIEEKKTRRKRASSEDDAAPEAKDE